MSKMEFSHEIRFENENIGYLCVIGNKVFGECIWSQKKKFPSFKDCYIINVRHKLRKENCELINLRVRRVITTLRSKGHHTLANKIDKVKDLI